jgi:hypothetical protein
MVEKLIENIEFLMQRFSEGENVLDKVCGLV